MANRGYAVLSINHRGSTCFGKNFINASNLRWGAKMQDDLLDAVNWTVEKGIADPSKLAVMGGSYGGYATLAAMTFTPKIFVCSVDVCGHSNLTSQLLSIPPYGSQRWNWSSIGLEITGLKKAVSSLAPRSPLNYVERIGRPLLIRQGANDPIVKKNDPNQVVGP